MLINATSAAAGIVPKEAAARPRFAAAGSATARRAAAIATIVNEEDVS